MMEIIIIEYQYSAIFYTCLRQIFIYGILSIATVNFPTVSEIIAKLRSL